MSETQNRLQRLMQRLSGDPERPVPPVMQAPPPKLPPAPEPAPPPKVAEPTPPGRLVGTIENDVLIGTGGVLFLAGGAHAVMDIVTGRQPVSARSIEVFADNIAARAAWAGNNGAPYLHIIFPDKQSVIPENWPLGTPLRMGEMFIERCKLDAPPIYYPRDLLAQHKAEAISKTDTHITAHGSVRVAGEIVRRLTGERQDAMVDRLLQTITHEEARSGDLGSKLNPPVMSVERLFSAPMPGRMLCNDLQGGNNGLIDLRFCARPVYDKRIVMFGDSFGRDVMRFLHYWFRETIFFRSGFFDSDLARMCQPDFLLTENVERYLDSCTPDAERPSFFMYPYLNGVPYAPSVEFARAFSAILSVPRPPYQALHAAEFPALASGVATLAPAAATDGVPAAFRSGVLPLRDWPAEEDDLSELEPVEVVTRCLPVFRVRPMGPLPANWCAPLQDIHSSNLVRRQNVLVFGSNLQVDAQGRWACESRSFKQQFFDSVASSFGSMFQGALPGMRKLGAANALDFDALSASQITIVTQPVFLATPLEPGNWGRWVVTVLPKIAQFKRYGQGRKLFCYAALPWQRSLFAHFGIADGALLEHNPGATYFCHDVMTVDYNVTNMTVSRQERALFASIRDAALETIAPSGADKLFVARLSLSARHPGYRVLQNERALADALTARGFQIIEPELMGFPEQVAAFGRAKIVVCIGGAALYNMVFCQPDTKVIDIESGETFLHPHGDLLSSLMLQYGVMLGEQDPTDATPVHKRWTIDVAAVCRQVEAFA